MSKIFAALACLLMTPAAYAQCGAHASTLPIAVAGLAEAAYLPLDLDAWDSGASVTFSATVVAESIGPGSAGRVEVVLGDQTVAIVRMPTVAGTVATITGTMTTVDGFDPEHIIYSVMYSAGHTGDGIVSSDIVASETDQSAGVATAHLRIWATGTYRVVAYRVCIED